MSLHDRDYMRDGGSREWGRPRAGFGVFHGVLILNIAVFVIQYVLGEGWDRNLLTGEPRPLGGVSLADLGRGEFLGLLTHMFVHGGFGHLVANMLLLWFAGRRVSEIYGGWKFLQIYLLSGVAGAAGQLAVSAYAWENTAVTLLGASGACFGVLVAYAVAVPNEELTALLYFVVPVQMRLKILTLFLVGMNLVLGVFSLLGLLPVWLAGSGGGQIAYFAHLGGALGGWYLAHAWGVGAMRANAMRLRAGDESMRRRRPHLARAVRRPAVELDTEAIRRDNPSHDPIIDLMENEVDPILEKITEQGINSLTDEERRTLERASRQIRRSQQRPV